MVLPYVFLCMGTPKGKRRDFEALEKRRFEAMRLLDEGLNQSETARRLTVARQTVSEWLRQYRAQGEAGLRKAGRAGRKPLLDATQLERLEILLLKGPEAQADLVKEVSRVVEISRREGAAVVETVFENILQTVREGSRVQIRRFGAFAARQRRGRIGRNPKIGEQVQVPPKRVPYLRPSTGLLELINGPL